MNQKKILDWFEDVHPEHTEEDLVRIAQEQDAFVAALIETHNALPLVLTERPDEDTLNT